MNRRILPFRPIATFSLGLLCLCAFSERLNAALFFTQASATASLDALKKANVDGSSVTTLADNSDDFSQPKGIAVDSSNGYIYVADALTNGGGIIRYNLNGTGRTVVVAPVSGTIYNDVAVAGNKIYFVQGSATTSLDALKSANLDGSGVTVLANDSSNFAQPGGVAVDLVNSFIYVADSLASGGGIIRFSLTGTGRTVVVAPTASAQYNDVAVAGSKIYFTQGSATASLDALKSANLDGSGLTTLASGAANFAQPGGLAVDATAGFIYIADASASGQGILRYTLAGGSRTVLISPTASSLYNDVSLEGGDVAPSAPSTPDLATASDLGSSNTDNITNDNTPTFTGTAESGSTVTILRNGSSVGSGVATGGNYSITTSSLAEGAGSITATATNLAGTSAASSALSITIDTTAPTISIGAPSVSLTSGGPVTYTVTYSDNSITLANGNVTLNSTGSASGTANVTGSGATRTVTVSSITGNGTLGISIAAGTATDTAGNTAAAAGPSTTFTVDNTAPTISIGAPSASVTAGGPVTYTVTYSGQNSISLANGNITVNSTGSASGTANVTGSGSTRTVTISSITGNGTLGISIAAGTASDTAGNSAAAAGPSTTFTVDNTPPTISIGAPSTPLTNSGPVSYTVTYTGANNASISLDVLDINFHNTGNVVVNGYEVSGSGGTRTVTLDTITGDGTLAFSIDAGTASDAAGNSAAASGQSTAVTVDNTAPTISIGAPSASLTSGGPVTYTVTYSDANFSSSTLANGNVTLNSTGSASGTVNVTGSGTTRTVTIGSITGSGTLGISVAAGTAGDTVGNTAAAAGPSTTFTVDNTAPSISIGAPSASLTSSGSVTYTVTYADANLSSSTLALGDITLNSTGTASATVGVSGSGTTRTVTLSSITGDGTLGISIAAGTASDTVGNLAAAAGPSTPFTVDNTAPVITSALSDSGTYRSSYGYAITASGSPASYGASGLPAGLGVDGGTGSISGTPTESGSFSISLSATDAAGNIGTATLGLSVAKITISVTGLSAANKPYDAGTLASLTGTPDLSGVITADNGNVSLGGTAVGVFSTATVGTGKTVSVSGLSLTGSAASNYVLTPLSLTADITAVQLTVTADEKSRPYGYANPTLTATITGFVGGESSGVLSGSPALSTGANSSSAVGGYAITAAIGTLSAANYTFAFVDGTLTVRFVEIADWEEENFTPSELLDPDISGPTADPDLDGVTNLYEYAFGTDPNDIASGPDKLVYSGTLAGGGTLVETGAPSSYLLSAPGSGLVTKLLYVRRNPAFGADLDYTPQFTSNGTTWVSSTALPDVLAESGLYQVVSVPYPLLVSGKKTRTYRVLAELTE